MKTLAAPVRKFSHSREPACPLTGKGLSSSSNEAAPTAATEARRSPHVIPLVKEVADRALACVWESAGHRVATQDVLAIVHGGVVAVRTGANGSYGAVPVRCTGSWMSDHVLLAVNPTSPGHDVPTLLDDLFGHPRRGDFVREFTALASAARKAVERGDAAALGDAVKAYVAGFDDWTGWHFTSGVREIMAEFEGVAVGLHGWKPPGAGACEAVALIHDGTHTAQGVATRFFRDRGWRIAPVRVTGGFNVEPRADGGVRISAGHRLDLIGAADLGIDPAIAVDGLCLAMAIEPRTSREV